jgi:HSP20 family molecular chaperone IbpA
MKVVEKNALISSICYISGYVLAGAIGGGAVLLALKLDPSLVSGLGPDSSLPINQSEFIEQAEESLEERTEGQQAFDSKRSRNPFDAFESMDSRSRDIFSQMRRMQESFFGGGIDNFFDSDLMDMDSGYGFGGKKISSGANITSREDQDFIYYEISGDSIENTSVSTSVEDGYLTITAEIHSGDSNAESDGSASSAFQSSFQSTMQRTFPLPGDVDESKLETLAEGSKIILRFPKVNS